MNDNQFNTFRQIGKELAEAGKVLVATGGLNVLVTAIKSNFNETKTSGQQYPTGIDSLYVSTGGDNTMYSELLNRAAEQTSGDLEKLLLFIKKSCLPDLENVINKTVEFYNTVENDNKFIKFNLKSSPIPGLYKDAPEFKALVEKFAALLTNDRSIYGLTIQDAAAINPETIVSYINKANAGPEVKNFMRSALEQEPNIMSLVATTVSNSIAGTWETTGQNRSNTLLELTIATLEFLVFAGLKESTPIQITRSNGDMVQLKDYEEIIYTETCKRAKTVATLLGHLTTQTNVMQRLILDVNQELRTITINQDVADQATGDDLSYEVICGAAMNGTTSLPAIKADKDALVAYWHNYSISNANKMAIIKQERIPSYLISAMKLSFVEAPLDGADAAMRAIEAHINSCPGVVFSSAQNVVNLVSEVMAMKYKAVNFEAFTTSYNTALQESPNAPLDKVVQVAVAEYCVNHILTQLNVASPK